MDGLSGLSGKKRCRQLLWTTLVCILSEQDFADASSPFKHIFLSIPRDLGVGIGISKILMV